MKTVVVTSKAATTAVSLRQDGTVLWDTKMFHDLPKVLGNADPVHYAQMLPGVQTSSELDAGLHIQGSDQTHNIFSIQGVPIYNAAHMLGIFSVFNASHYSSMALTPNAHDAAYPSRLGGRIDMELEHTLSDSLSAEFSVGLISSQGTLRLPTSQRSTLILSGRASYLNLLYGSWLRDDDTQLYYSFYDANATWLWQPSPNHRLWADFYMGDDNALMKESEYMARMKLKWGNRAVALHWQADLRREVVLNNSIYFTSFRNQMRLSQASVVFRIPSDIRDIGYKGSVQWKGLSAGAEAIWHDILPQAPQSEGIQITQFASQARLHTQEYALHADWRQPLFQIAELTAGLRGTAYVDNLHETHLSADPSVSLGVEKSQWSLTTTYSFRHQYLFQTGTTSLGMPTEFWTSIGGDTHPQWGHGPSLSANVYLAQGRYRVSAEAYYRRLFHQTEYDGDMMRFLNTAYKLEDNLLYGRGRNYGFSLMLHKRTGALTGWLSYAYGRARRNFDTEGLSGTFSANHERPHEVNALAAWHLGKRWTLSGIFTYASGIPFTAPEHFYVVDGFLLAEYGRHNGNRVRPYYRLDLSVNYLFASRRVKEHGLNFSLYNATFHQNDITCRLKMKSYENYFLYSHYSLIDYALPSVSYFLKY